MGDWGAGRSFRSRGVSLTEQFDEPVTDTVSGGYAPGFDRRQVATALCVAQIWHAAVWSLAIVIER